MDVKKYFSVRGGFLRREMAQVHAVDGVTLNIRQGETVALVGESGCGKTTLGRLLLRLIDPTGGDVFYDVPEDRLRAYEAGPKQDAPGTADPSREDFLRQYSITWRERIQGSGAYLAALLISLGVATGAAIFLPSVFLAWLSPDVTNLGAVALFGIVLGAVAGFFGAIVLRRPAERTPEFLAGLAFILSSIEAATAPLFRTWFFGGSGPYDFGTAYVDAWDNGGGGVFLAMVLAPVAALTVARMTARVRERRAGKQRHRLKDIRKNMQPVFQDPFTSLNPRMLVKDIIAEPILINKLMSREEASDRAELLLKEVGLRADHLYRFPHEFSGGQRQRIAVARALAPQPQFLLLDEPTSALDVSVQAQILNLLKEIQRKQGLTYLLITHNLSVVKQMANRVAVMYLGEIVEEAPTGELFENPLHPYTKALLSAVPVPDPKKKRDRIILAGDVPSPIDPPTGCRFHTRCNAVMPTCGWSSKDLVHLASYLFDPSRNPDAEGLPALQEITLRGDDLRLHFPRGSVTEEHRARIEALVKGQTEGPKRTLFRAIRSVRRSADAVDLEFLPAREPRLVEVSAGHRVACYLYPEPAGSGADPIPGPLTSGTLPTPESTSPPGRALPDRTST